MTCVGCAQPLPGPTPTCPSCGVVQPVAAPVGPDRTAVPGGPTELERLIAQNNLRHPTPRRSINKGKLFTQVTGGIGALILAAIIALNVLPFGAGDATTALNTATAQLAMTRDATTLGSLEDQYATAHATTGLPLTAPAKATTAVGDAGTFTPTGTDSATVTVTGTGYCVIVTNPASKSPVDYDSGTASTLATTPGICG